MINLSKKILFLIVIASITSSLIISNMVRKKYYKVVPVPRAIERKIIINGDVELSKPKSLTLQDLEIFVISLDRTPERYDFIKNQLDKFGLKHQKFSAVDGYATDIIEKDSGVKFKGEGLKNGKVKFNPEKKYEIITKGSANIYSPAKNDRNKYLTAGEIGCTVSHIEILQKIVREKIEYSLILEDDAELIGDFDKKLSYILDNFFDEIDFLYLGGNPMDNQILYNINNNNHMVKKVKPMNKPVWYAISYIISYEGAKKLLEKLIPEFNNTIDCVYSDLLISKYMDFYLTFPLLVNTPENDHLKENSLITKMGR